MSQSATLLGVSPEILNLIIDGIEEYSNVRKQSLKALRESCRQLAYSSIIHENLFVKVRFYRTPESMKRVDELDFWRFASYVKEVNFYPSQYSSSMTLDVFEEIVNWQRMDDVMDWKEKEKWSEVGSILARKDDVQQVIKEHYNGDYPLFSAEDLKEGYEDYQHLASTVEDSVIEDLWTQLLERMDKCTAVSTSWLSDHPPSPRKMKEEKNCRVRLRHKHDYRHHRDEACARIDATPGDELFANVVHSLARSQFKLKMFDINHHTTGHYRQFPEMLTHLNLSSLEGFSFSPMCCCSDSDDDIEAAAAGVVAFIQRKSQSTLKSLYIGAESPIQFPGDANLISMPCLTELAVGSISLFIFKFSKFLLLQENLQKLEMTCTNKVEGSGRWRKIWDAIRDHPSRMHLSFDQVPCNDAAELSCEHYTGDASEGGVDLELDDDVDASDFSDDESVSSEMESAVWEDIDRSFENYVSRKGPWNRSMRSWFG